MKKNEQASITIKKIILISIIFIMLLGVSVLARTTKVNDVIIKFPTNYEITVLTTKTKVKDILDENHIILEENQTVTPGLEENIEGLDTIVISTIGNEPVKKAENVNTVVSTEEIVKEYENITEKIITVIEEIPFETITKDVSNGSATTTNRVVQYGRNGKKQIVYKITFKDEVEISREELSSEIIKEPVNKIVEVQTKTVTSRGSYIRTGTTTAQSGIYKVTAYCACAKCCGKTNGITASGVKATANHTIAAPSTFAFGTKVVINGTTYVVEDRGGAIQGNRIDVYMNSHEEALRWGVRYLQLDIIE